MKIVQSTFFLVTVLSGLFFSCQEKDDAGDVILELSYSVPVEGNCWITEAGEGDVQISEKGITNWTDGSSRFQVYFKTESTGKLNVALVTGSTMGDSEVELKLGSEIKTCRIGNQKNDTIYAGVFNVKNVGYQVLNIQGIKKEGDYFPEIKAILIGGEATTGKVYFAKDEFYWARRGPSVHLNFEVPEDAGNIIYFYNEITVPENNDVLGSYFMADGFGQGYFGMQVNSPTERHILFSVWSPFETNNPGEIPDEYKIQLLKKGEGVHTGEFGDEGSGGQSYFVFPWKPEVTYQFLLKGVPAGNGETDFTAWFFAPEINHWKLIASFRRPKTDTYLTHLYSFLENFMTETGNISRMAQYSNQWVYSTSGKWTELTRIKFTADATARKESRMDYTGGAEKNYFFLKNCGFFSITTPIDSFFERERNGTPPEINFDALP